MTTVHNVGKHMSLRMTSLHVHVAPVVLVVLN